MARSVQEPKKGSSNVVIAYCRSCNREFLASYRKGEYLMETRAFGGDKPHIETDCDYRQGEAKNVPSAYDRV